MRIQSAGFFVTMSLGAALYDSTLMQQVANGLGMPLQLNQSVTLRFPVYLTFFMALLTLLSTLLMKDVKPQDTDCPEPTGCITSIVQSIHLTLKTGQWIWKTSPVLLLILTGMFFDHIIRMLTTMNSQYFRIIHLPEASFGLIGSGMALVGMLIPRLAHLMARNRSILFNMGIMAVMSYAGFVGITFFLPLAGLIPFVLVSSVIYFNRFFLSYYLNQETSSFQRATVLSFKGLAFNLAYGILGLAYAYFLALMRAQMVARIPAISSTELEKILFIHSVKWFPWYFLAALAILAGFALLRKSRQQ